jgi:urease accessory protein
VATNAVAVERAGGRSVVTRLLARSPLRLLTPANAGVGAWVYASTFGGGLVAGDRIALEVAVGPGATALVGTQAQTKVYRGESAQTVRVTVGDGALLAWLPDPVVPYAGARYAQEIDVTLAGGSLVLCEGLTCGRSARGERWAFARFASRVRVRAPELVLDDGLLLDPAHGPLGPRVGRWRAFATVLALGPRAAPVAEALAEAGADGPEVRIGESPVAGGVLARVGAIDTAGAVAAVRRLLAALPALLGDDPFARKW